MLQEEKKRLYTAFKAKDIRLDGRFFVGISSTGIYCRPICSARQPKFENCTFYDSAAKAEQAGYRPCLLCRPELAPGKARIDSKHALAQRAARMIEENLGSGQQISHLAEALGCTDRHLRRVFLAEYQVSPVQYLQTCRLLLAKNLLTDTSLSVLEVAMAAGFGSLRRFNDLFKKHYHLSPTALRKKIPMGEEKQKGITVLLGYRPPYLWAQMLDFLKLRAIKGVELVREGSYLRTVRLQNNRGEPVYGHIKVKHCPEKTALAVTISETLLPVLPQVLARVKHLFDLYCEPTAVFETLAQMNEIRPASCIEGTRVPGCFDAFEMIVRAVLGQQITVKAAGTLAARIVEAYGTPIKTGMEGLSHVFPAPEEIVALPGQIEAHLGSLGVIASRARTIKRLAEEIAQKKIDFDFSVQPEIEIEKLLEIPGIGSWTAHYIAMRTMAWTDAFLETDAGIKKALSAYSPKERLALAEHWRPWRSYATMNLWQSL
ncbi:MAG: DNA-3-methyladenine glycosylase 2 family protein [Christensenellaceae bacterium]|jgi:AraC family transcriptional regulator of adaptative response / DNA-3-methyladenine glycosylase II